MLIDRKWKAILLRFCIKKSSEKNWPVIFFYSIQWRNRERETETETEAFDLPYFPPIFESIIYSNRLLIDGFLF